MVKNGGVTSRGIRKIPALVKLLIAPPTGCLSISADNFPPSLCHSYSSTSNQNAVVPRKVSVIARKRSAALQNAGDTSNSENSRARTFTATTGHNNADSAREPLLMLEGDEFCVSSDGVARSFYSLEKSSIPDHTLSPISIEEYYHIKTARKRFVLRKDPVTQMSCESTGGKDILRKNVQGVARLGPIVTSFEFQEIDQGVLSSAGTGATTWESSIAMSLYFSAHPELLCGNIIELGTGLGLGGIVIGANPCAQIESITLTDYNSKVLDQCNQNIEHAAKSQHCFDRNAFRVKNLNWYDFLSGDTENLCGEYDNVIVCDCAYLYPDICALSCAISNLLLRKKDSQAHMFGPYNRGALYELIDQLKDKKMKVVVEWVEMNRFRLRPSTNHNKNPSAGSIGGIVEQTESECPFASKHIVKFLHITASHEDGQHTHSSKIEHGSITDID